MNINHSRQTKIPPHEVVGKSQLAGLKQFLHGDKALAATMVRSKLIEEMRAASRFAEPDFERGDLR